MSRNCSRRRNRVASTCASAGTGAVTAIPNSTAHSAADNPLPCMASCPVTAPVGRLRWRRITQSGRRDGGGNHRGQRVAPGRQLHAEIAPQPGGVQARIGRPSCRRGVVGGGDRQHARCPGQQPGSHGFGEDRLGKAMPAGLPACDQVAKVPLIGEPGTSACCSAPAVTSAISAAGVGVPVWSATTRSSSRSAPRRSIVRRKLWPCAA